MVSQARVEKSTFIFVASPRNEASSSGCLPVCQNEHWYTYMYMVYIHVHTMSIRQ